MANPFGLLRDSQAIGEAVHLTVFTTYFVPMTFLFKTTYILISLAWLLAALPTVYYYGIGSCRFQYFDDYWRFGFAQNERCPEIPLPTNVITFSACTSVIIILDFISLYRVRVHNRKIMNLQQHSGWNNARRDDEVNFLKQTCLQSLLFTLGIVAYFVLPYHFEYPWINFGFTTVTWVSVHTFDGIMTLLYNREFRSIFQKNRQRIAWINSSTRQELQQTERSKKSFLDNAIFFVKVRRI
ncbi:hypothetical protein RB195_004000 [Necator americanus]|uniref:7TM GPCR serpentine receptor class x (Srx) domain-containing protein n=1 Tax=Necator americanus TaxID=51031 RepID=A0ABR1DR73_NECAM